MNKKNALLILGLDENASVIDIENRYAILVKQEHNKYSMRDIDLCTEAYVFLRGEPNRSAIIRNNAGKYLKKSRLLYLLLLIVPVLIAFIVILNNKQPDLKIEIIGDIIITKEGVNDLKQIIQGQYPEIAHIDINYGYVDSRFTGYSSIFNKEKRITLASYSTADIMIIDYLTYNDLYESGIFKDIMTLIDVSKLKILIQEKSLPGLTITKTYIVEKLGMTGENQVIVVKSNSKRLNNAIKALKSLMPYIYFKPELP